MAVHCERCRWEDKTVTAEVVHQEGVERMRCPHCKKRGDWGDLPPERPKPQELAQERKGVESMRALYKTLGTPDEMRALRQHRDELLAERQRLLNAGVEPAAIAKLAENPEAELARVDAQLAEREDKVLRVEQELAVAEKRLTALEGAEEWHARRDAESELASPLPGDSAIAKAARDVAKHREARNTEIRRRLALAEKHGLPKPSYPTLDVAVAWRIGSME